MRIIAYTYEADVHCIDCTRKRFQRSLCIHYIQGKPCNNCRDSNGLLYEQQDNEGNLVHPLFSHVTMIGNRYLPMVCVCNDDQHLICGDCHEIIETYTIESEVTV